MDLPRCNDEELLLCRGSLAGAAFGELYQRHVALIVAYHQRRVSNPEVAADLTAETFAQALASRDRFEGTGPGSVVRWLYGIAANVLRHTLRRAAVERRKMDRLRLDRPVLDDAHLKAIEESADDDAVSRALQLLPVDQRVVVKALVLDDDDYATIASRLSLEPAAVRKRASRGLRTLRRRYEETS